MLSSATDRFAGNLSSAIMNQNDPATVREGAPAYLILVDGLIKGEPENQALLLTGARLYDVYAVVFVDDSERARRLTEKGWGFSQRALCLEYPDECERYRQPYSDYVDFLATLDRADVPLLYAFGAAWASWIQTHPDDWNARADIPKVGATMQRVVELDENYDSGGARLYLGVLSIMMPPALGGKPERARTHFERAIAISKGRNLMFKVIFAERFARTLFDRSLHDRLLREVIEADAEEPDLTLMNLLAQKKARALLDSADDYF